MVKKAEKILAEKVSIELRSKQQRLGMWVRSDNLDELRFNYCISCVELRDSCW